MNAITPRVIEQWLYWIKSMLTLIQRHKPHLLQGSSAGGYFCAYDKRYGTVALFPVGEPNLEKWKRQLALCQYSAHQLARAGQTTSYESWDPDKDLTAGAVLVDDHLIFSFRSSAFWECDEALMMLLAECYRQQPVAWQSALDIREAENPFYSQLEPLADRLTSFKRH